jgi:phosphoenolpyruvate carboxykinase (ATP)
LIYKEGVEEVFNLEHFLETVKEIEGKAVAEGRLLANPSDEELRPLVEKQPGVKKTRYNNFVAQTEPTSRAAPFTKNSADHPFGEEEEKLLEQCKSGLANKKLILIDRIVGNENSNVTARLIVPERFAHVAYGGKNLFLPPKEKVTKPTYYVVMFYDDSFEKNMEKPLEEKDITIRLAMFDDGRVIKIVRNSNYIGEYKKGVFAGEGWRVKKKTNGIFLHAGCREDYLQNTYGEYKIVRSLFVALSANGKTTLTSKIMARKGKESSWLIQDDGGTLMPDGSFRGFEGSGIFVKTEGVDLKDQLEIYYALLKPGIVCENVYLDDEGDFDFYNYELTSNGRAVVKRGDFLHAAPYIDVPQIDNLFLITRDPIIPAICKLTKEEATGLMCLGQSMESSAGDPSRAGKIKQEFFYDPFMAGDKAEHANRFYNILKNLNINCYLVNTGKIGEGGAEIKVRLTDTLAILDSVLREGLPEESGWEDSCCGFKVPKTLRRVDKTYFHPEKLYNRKELERKQKELNRLRYESLKGIHPSLSWILASFPWLQF